MKTTTRYRDGFYMNVTLEERNIIEELKRDYAINLSQAFKLFLKEMLRRAKNETNHKN
jgi:hypothetical protein